MRTQDGGDDDKDTDVISNAQTTAQTNTASTSSGMVSREQFDREQYLKDHPDVAQAIAQGQFGGDPYQHYMQYGFKEGRTAKPKPVTAPTTPPPPTPPGTPPANGNSNARVDQAKVQAILAKYPHTPAGLKQALPDIQAMYPNVKLMGSKGDKLDFSAHGGRIVDVITSAGTGGTGWQWLEDNGGAGGAGGAGGTSGGNFTPYSGPEFAGNTPLGALGSFTPPPNTMGQFTAPAGSGQYTPFSFGGTPNATGANALSNRRDTNGMQGGGFMGGKTTGAQDNGVIGQVYNKDTDQPGSQAPGNPQNPFGPNPNDPSTWQSFRAETGQPQQPDKNDPRQGNALSYDPTQTLGAPTQHQAPTPYTPGQVRYDPVTNQPIQASSASAPQYAAQSAGDAQTATAQQMNAPNAITGRDVTGPAALQSTNLGAADKFQGVSKADLESDPSYQFRLSQGLGAIQNSAASKGALRTGGTLKGLNDYAGQSASQEYQNVYGRKLGEFNNAFAQGAQVNQQNNSNQAQAYGLTNQYGQAAQMANQQNSYNVQSQNAQNQMQSGMFNVGQANQIAQQNAQNQNQMRQFNTGQSNTVGMQNAGNQLQANLSNAQMAQQASTQNASNALQAGQFNSNLGYQANAQNVQNGMTAAQQNYQNQFNAVNANNATNLSYNNQAYGQAANTYGMNQQAQNQAYQQAQNAYTTNLGAQNQFYNQAAGTYGLNLGANQQQYAQNLAAWQANVNAQMGYGQYQLANNALGYLQSGGN